MPNHVTNILIASRRVLDALTREHTESEKDEIWVYGQSLPVRTDEREIDARLVDFNLLIPEPHHTDPVFTAERSEYPGGMVGYSPEGFSPLDWHRQHWGTKWNGYDLSVESLSEGLFRIRFDTAWSHPGPVMDALAAKFPDEVIDVEYADEDFGSNLGTYRIENGEIVDLFQPEYGTDEANELAARVKYGKTYAEVRADWEEVDECPSAH